MDLILPITLGVCLIASQKKSIMGEIIIIQYYYWFLE